VGPSNSIESGLDKDGDREATRRRINPCGCGIRTGVLEHWMTYTDLVLSEVESRKGFNCRVSVDVYM